MTQHVTNTSQVQLQNYWFWSKVEMCFTHERIWLRHALRTRLDLLSNRTGFGGLIIGFRNCLASFPEIEVSNGVKKGQRKPNQANVKKKTFFFSYRLWYNAVLASVQTCVLVPWNITKMERKTVKIFIQMKHGLR